MFATCCCCCSWCFCMKEIKLSPQQDSTSLCPIINHLLYFLSLSPSLFLASLPFVFLSPMWDSPSISFSVSDSYKQKHNSKISDKGTSPLYLFIYLVILFPSVLLKSHWAKFWRSYSHPSLRKYSCGIIRSWALLRKKHSWNALLWYIFTLNMAMLFDILQWDCKWSKALSQLKNYTRAQYPNWRRIPES